jgi:hypothetical protein
VVVSEETYGILDPLLEAEPMQALALKGFPRPITAYRVTGTRTAGGRPRGIPGLSALVIGRQRPLMRVPPTSISEAPSAPPSSR